MSTPGRSCRHCDGTQKRKKKYRSFKKRSAEQILDLVREWVLDWHERTKNESYRKFMKEPIAVGLKLKEHEVEHALHKLNLEGLVSKPEHRAPHDSSRDPWSWGKGDSAWMGDLYTVIDERT